MKDIYVFVGLGNPGERYRDTHHNMGYMAIDHYAQSHGVNFSKAECDADVAYIISGDKKIILAKPTTFMNNSGQSVAKFVKKYKVPLDHLVIIYDDIDIECGTLRMRKAGSAGTHNGMRSIVECLGDTAFPRIRIGTGYDRSYDLVDFVLSPLNDLERAVIAKNKIFERVTSALDKFVANGGDIEKIIL